MNQLRKWLASCLPVRRHGERPSRRRAAGQHAVFSDVLLMERPRLFTPMGSVLLDEFANIFAEVGSFYPLRENFRLTPEVKQKFTEKLRRDPSEFHGIEVASAVRRRTQIGPRRRIVGLLRLSGTEQWCAFIAKRAAGKASQS